MREWGKGNKVIRARHLSRSKGPAQVRRKKASAAGSNKCAATVARQPENFIAVGSCTDWNFVCSSGGINNKQ